MAISTLTSKGQITVPKNVRDLLRLKVGDKLDFRLNENGEVKLVPIRKSIDEAFGCLAKKVKKSLSIDQMKDAVAQRFK